MYHFSIHYHFVVIVITCLFGSKDFLKKAHLWSCCISFLWIFFLLPLLYFFYLLGWSCIFQYSFLKQHTRKCHWSVYKKTENTLLKGCSKQNHPVKFSANANLLAFFFFLIITPARLRCRGVCCSQGKSEQMESWGISRKMERIFWIAFASRVKLLAK